MAIPDLLGKTWCLAFQKPGVPSHPCPNHHPQLINHINFLLPIDEKHRNQQGIQVQKCIYIMCICDILQVWNPKLNKKIRMVSQPGKKKTGFLFFPSEGIQHQKYQKLIAEIPYRILQSPNLGKLSEWISKKAPERSASTHDRFPWEC